MKTLKQIFREHGFEVNRDNQKGIGNKAILEQLKVWYAFLIQDLSDSDIENLIYEMEEEIKKEHNYPKS
jgi:hypothetical protein